MGKILFHHIPKTAGTSLVAHARNHFGERVYVGRYDEQVSDDIILDERYQFYHGHFTRRFVLHFRDLVPDAKIFTFLRHPFNRTLSQYYNWVDRQRVRRELDVITAMSGATDNVWRLRIKFEETIFGMSLDDFLQSQDPDVLQATDNLQSQYMTPAEDTPGFMRFHAAAINAVSFYDFIGVQELYEPCLRLIESKFSLTAGCLGGTERNNTADYAKSDGRYQVTDHQMRLLESRNVYDLALYHTCYAMLLKEHGEWLPRQAVDFISAVALPQVGGSVGSSEA